MEEFELLMQARSSLEQASNQLVKAFQLAAIREITDHPIEFLADIMEKKFSGDANDIRLIRERVFIEFLAVDKMIGEYEANLKLVLH